MAFIRSKRSSGGLQLFLLGSLLGATLAAGCGGGKVAGAIGCTDPLMIDDMEDGDQYICTSGGRKGWWYTVGDGTSTNLSPPANVGLSLPDTAFAQTLIPGGRESSREAARLTGFGFTKWGAAMGSWLNATAQGIEPYDASATQGIRFWLMSNVPVPVYFPLADTLSVSEAAGGTCVDTATEWNCDNHFGFFISAPQPGVWTEYHVPFAALAQLGYRYDEQGNPIVGNRTFDPTQLISVQFNVDGDQTFDVWIDDLGFYSCGGSDCLPTCTDPAAPVACPAAGGAPAFCWPTGTNCSQVLNFNVDSVSGTGPGDVWAVGYEGAQFTGAIVHWNGTSWSFVPSGTPYMLNGVWGSGPEDVWAVGNNGTILHWDGSSWSQTASATTFPLEAVWGSGPADVWAVGEGGTVLHWNGTVWSTVSSGTIYILSAVSGSGPSDVWVVGEGGLTIHWDGTTWSAASSGTALPLTSVWGSAPGDVWAVGANGTALHWNGTAWSTVPSGTTQNLWHLWGSGSGDVWAVGADALHGTGTIIHWNGTAWSTVVSDNARALLAVWGSGPGDVWALGEWADALHWGGTDWSAVTIDGPPQ
jgi:hypothetical protein